MKKLIILLLGLSLTGCSTTYHLSTLNHDPIYDTVLEVPADVQIDTLSYRQLQWKLRTDFNFRYDFAQYALSQPRSFDWNNRILGNRYNFYNPYWSYSYSWNRDQMWNDWVWGYPYSNWGWNSWSSWNRPYWGYSNYYGWNGYNNWYNGPWHNPGYNVIWNSSRQNNNIAYINGRRGSNITNYNNRGIINQIATNSNVPREDVKNNNINNIVRDLRNKGIRVINNNNNDQINRPNPRIYVRPESSSNGRGSWSRENVPVKPIVPIVTPTNQSRQVYRGSGSSSVQQSRGSSTSSRQKSGGASRQRN